MTLISEFKRVTEGRDYRYDSYCHSVVCEGLIRLQGPAVQIGRDRICPAVNIVDTEIPYARIASFRGLDEVHSQIKSVIVRKLHIIGFGIYMLRTR